MPGADIFRELLDGSRKAFAEGFYEAAFHALSAALHVAEQLRDEALIRAVQEEGGKQLVEIDTYHTGHPISSESAAQRGHAGVYASLQTQARAALAIARSPQRNI